MGLIHKYILSFLWNSCFIITQSELLLTGNDILWLWLQPQQEKTLSDVVLRHFWQVARSL